MSNASLFFRRFALTIIVTVGLLSTQSESAVAGSQNEYDLGHSPTLRQYPCPRGFVPATLNLINSIRLEHNLFPLRASESLMDSANLRTFDMANKLRLTHDGWRESIVNAGFNGLSRAENIAAGYNSPYEVVKGWLESRLHRENLMDENYIYTGIACARGADGRLWWTQHFGS